MGLMPECTPLPPNAHGMKRSNALCNPPPPSALFTFTTVIVLKETLPLAYRSFDREMVPS